MSSYSSWLGSYSFKKFSRSLDTVAKSFLARVRAMKCGTTTLVLEGDRGTGAFNHPATQRYKQRLNSSPLKIPIDWISPDNIQSASLLAVHVKNDSIFMAICKQKKAGNLGSGNLTPC